LTVQGYRYFGFASLYIRGSIPFFGSGMQGKLAHQEDVTAISFTDRFITPFASLNMRSFTILALNQTISSALSASSIPANTNKPF
jgi:hypothetical protein